MSKLLKIKVSSCLKAQKLLNLYRKLGNSVTELERIEYAQELCLRWNKNKIPFPPLAVPERNDFWYLTQLYFIDKHINNNKKIYNFDLGRDEDIYIKTSGLILDLLKTINKNNNFLPLSRDGLDKLIKLNGNKLLDILGMDHNLFKIIPIPFDINLRLGNQINKVNKITNVFFDGYRQRTDNTVTALFGGNSVFGGVAFVDSIWKDSVYNSIYPQLIIIRKDYGD